MEVRLHDVVLVLIGSVVLFPEWYIAYRLAGWISVGIQIQTHIEYYRIAIWIGISVQSLFVVFLFVNAYRKAKDKEGF